MERWYPITSAAIAMLKSIGFKYAGRTDPYPVIVHRWFYKGKVYELERTFGNRLRYRYCGITVTVGRYIVAIKIPGRSLKKFSTRSLDSINTFITKAVDDAKAELCNQAT